MSSRSGLFPVPMDTSTTPAETLWSVNGLFEKTGLIFSIFICTLGIISLVAWLGICLYETVMWLCGTTKCPADIYDEPSSNDVGEDNDGGGVTSQHTCGPPPYDKVITERYTGSIDTLTEVPTYEEACHLMGVTPSPSAINRSRSPLDVSVEDIPSGTPPPTYSALMQREESHEVYSREPSGGVRSVFINM